MKGFDKQGVDGSDICVISADEHVPYQRPPLSKGFLAGEQALEDILINSPEFYEERGVQLHLNTWIKSVDIEQKQLTSVSGDVFGYEKLLVATGGWPRELKIGASDLENVFYLRNVGHSRAIAERMDTADKAVVIGAGFIGMEVASILADRDVDVTMVYMEPQVLQHVFPEEIASYFEGYYEENGVRLVPEATVEAIDGNGAGGVGGVTLESGEKLDAEMVVAGIGVYPEISCIAKTALKIDDGVIANEYLETSSDDVYVAGDIACYYDRVFDKRRRVEHEDNARHQGKHVAGVMTGQREPFVHVPHFYSDMFDLSWEYWGDQEAADRILYRGEIESGEFHAWWMQEHRVVAAFALNKPWKQGKFIDDLIEGHTRVNPDRLTDENVEIEVLGQ